MQQALFEDLEPELWQQAGGNLLLLMLRCINRENPDRAAADRIYLACYRRAAAHSKRYAWTLSRVGATHCGISTRTSHAVNANPMGQPDARAARVRHRPT